MAKFSDQKGIGVQEHASVSAGECSRYTHRYQKSTLQLQSPLHGLFQPLVLGSHLSNYDLNKAYIENPDKF